MQEKKIKFTDVLFVGLAFFASYFGAGNLIFPPMLGLPVTSPESFGGASSPA